MGCVVIGVIEVNERHIMLKFQVGPNRNALIPDHSGFYDVYAS